MSPDEKKKPEMDGPKLNEDKPDDMSVIDLTDYQVVKRESFRRLARKKTRRPYDP